MSTSWTAADRFKPAPKCWKRRWQSLRCSRAMDERTGIAVFLCLSCVASLKLIGMEVPGAVMRGDPIWLNCSFDLENDELYSVKWYKNNVEFYRYLPSDNDRAVQKYDMPGVYIDLSKSHLGHLFFSYSDLDTEGVYRCEVSAEAPSFQTVREEKEIRVYVLPKRKPTITGLRGHYQVGEELNLTCLAGPSKPPPDIVWYINGQLVPSEFQVIHRSQPPGAPVAARASTLRLSAEQSYVRRGALNLTCRARVPVAYSVTRDEIVVNNKTLLVGYRPSILASPDSPTISADRLQFQIGDVVELNCTAARSRPPAVVKWFLNDKEVPPDLLRHNPPKIYADHKVAASVGLRLRVTQSHFEHDELRLRCTATLSRLEEYQVSEMVYVHARPPGSLQYSRVSNGAQKLQGVSGLLFSWMLWCRIFSGL